MVLDEIVTYKRAQIEKLRAKTPLDVLEAEVRKEGVARRSLQRALSSSGDLHLICELKKASPSEGLLRADFDPVSIAKDFESCGASAISILTETKYFQGSPETPKQVRDHTSIPLLRKDFIVDPYQVFETATLKADAFLLIVTILKDQELSMLLELGKELGLETLVEVHTEKELDRAVKAQARIIGINSRNLKTLQVDRSVVERLIKRVPKNIPVVVESGIESHDDITRYQALGARCFLIGTALMKSSNIPEKLGQLRGQQVS